MGFRGAYPVMYAALVRMARGKSTKKLMANKMARKAGLRRPAGTTPGGPVTLIDATLPADFAPLEWQWRIDLSPYTRLRLDARSADDLSLYYSLTGDTSNTLDPGDYALLSGPLSASDATGQPGDSLGWQELEPEERVSTRLCFVGSGGVEDREDLGGPVGVFLQAE